MLTWFYYSLIYLSANNCLTSTVMCVKLTRLDYLAASGAACVCVLIHINYVCSGGWNCLYLHIPLDTSLTSPSGEEPDVKSLLID